MAGRQARPGPDPVPAEPGLQRRGLRLVLRPAARPLRPPGGVRAASPELVRAARRGPATELPDRPRRGRSRDLPGRGPAGWLAGPDLLALARLAQRLPLGL